MGSPTAATKPRGVSGDMPTRRAQTSYISHVPFQPLPVCRSRQYSRLHSRLRASPDKILAANSASLLRTPSLRVCCQSTSAPSIVVVRCSQPDSGCRKSSKHPPSRARAGRGRPQPGTTTVSPGLDLKNRRLHEQQLLLVPSADCLMRRGELVSMLPTRPALRGRASEVTSRLTS